MNSIFMNPKKTCEQILFARVKEVALNMFHITLFAATIF